MSTPTHNAGHSGVQNTGPGTINITGSAVGPNSTVRNELQPEGRPRAASGPLTSHWDIGVITILSEETRAVIDALSAAGTCRQKTRNDGPRCHEAVVEVAGQDITVVAMQAIDRGQRAAVIAFNQIRERYDPSVVVLVGIAGAISPAVRLGDVVVVQDVIYYDTRKESTTGTAHRGQDRPVPASIRHAINDFFTDHGEPYRATINGPDGIRRTCHVLPGPIGSGEAVIADQDSPIRQYLTAFHDKVLAVETEAAGIAEAFYAQAAAPSPGGGWLAIRGISDDASPRKDDTYHEIASQHAAAILVQLLPYLTRAAGTSR